MRRSIFCLRGTPKSRVSAILPIEMFRTLQLGAYPAPAVAKRFMEVNFSKELLERGISPIKLAAMEHNSASALLKKLFQSKFLSVPCRIITFDMEFTSSPSFTNDGPTEEITEIGAYCPIRGKVFSRLVRCDKKIPEEVTKLTGISNAMLEKEGIPFPDAWREFVDFIENDDWQPPMDVSNEETVQGSKLTQTKNFQKNEQSGDKGKKETSKALTTEEINSQGEKSVRYDPLDISRIPSTLEPMGKGKLQQRVPRMLLLSHGGKLADITMLEWALKKHNLTLPETYKFADTHGIIQDLHQRRPVTQDKHPPSMKLSELCAWLKTPVPKTIHRAGPDAAMTWSALFHTLDRYGDESRTPHQQLVLRFFEKETMEIMTEFGKPPTEQVGTLEGETTAENDMSVLDLDLDSILK